jgi:dolichyl-diphosphooligosaccharide--protein glycosyltransferase
MSSLYATTKGMRFILQATPVITISFSAFLGITWGYVSNWVSKELNISKIATQVVIFVLLALLLIQPVQAGYQQAYNSVPSMNDGWYNTLLKIKTEAPQNIIITSWWDFGYWFRAIADRPVTFDGGYQTEWGAHLVGKSLLTTDEKHTAGILRMLNCGQNNAFDELDKVLNDTHKEIGILDKIVTQSKEDAVTTLSKEGLTPEQIENVIKYTHCDAPVDYYITSDDMVGKAGVWGHFGSWDFRKAEMWQQTNGKDKTIAVNLLISEFNVTAEQADKLYYEIQNTPADQWVANWPGYFSGLNTCNKASPTLLNCNVATTQGTLVIGINLTNTNSIDAVIKTTTAEVIHPVSLVYANKDKVLENKYTDSKVTFSVILIPNGDGYQIILADPLHAYSTFTKLFFFDGHGLTCFKKFDEAKPFTGGKVSTWIVDYSCKQENKVFFLPKEEVKAAHILISTQKHSDEEALKLINNIKANLTTSNFGEYAKKYSDDTGSAVNGGELGWFGKGVMVPEFQKVAFELKKGDISEPFKTQFGYHIILLEDKKVSQ